MIFHGFPMVFALVSPENLCVPGVHHLEPSPGARREAHARIRAAFGAMDAVVK